MLSKIQSVVYEDDLVEDEDGKQQSLEDVVGEQPQHAYSKEELVEEEEEKEEEETRPDDIKSQLVLKKESGGVLRNQLPEGCFSFRCCQQRFG